MIEDKIRIEFAAFSDAAEIGLMSKHDIEYGLGWKYTPARIGRLINDSLRNVVVARIGSDLAGFGIMAYYEHQANLDLLAVKPDFRRRGVGKQLVAWLEKVALTAGVFNVFVQVRAGNTGAVRFYQSLGYAALGQDKAYYSGVEAGVIMAKSLRPMFDAG